uniref:Uncharacterized protein n=1 Tax=Rhodopseudomonas palustris (strain BisA53) TaxID=316055 RepID=Q07SG5_RHOP5
MSADKVARLLADFDRPDLSKGRGRVVPFDYALHSGAKASPKPLPVQEAPPEDDAYQRGMAEGYAAALAEYELKLNDAKNAFNTQLEEQRNDLLNDSAAGIANAVLEVGSQLEARIAGVTARILEPLISNAVQRQAVAGFIEKLSTVASDGRRPALRIKGPAELLDLVKSKLGARSITMEFRAEPVAEVSVAVDEIVLETQVKIWADRLKLAVLG